MPRGAAQTATRIPATSDNMTWKLQKPFDTYLSPVPSRSGKRAVQLD